MGAKIGVIYCYTYKPTQEKYIGQTTNLNKRLNEHLKEKRVNLRFHNLLRKDFNNFVIQILEENIPLDQLDIKEKYYIKLFNTKEKGFNLTSGGDGGFEGCQNYWKTHEKKKKEHINKILPLAQKAAKEWRKQNPELVKENVKKLQEKSAEWRKTHPQEFRQNLQKAQQAAKRWRETHPKELKAAREKSVQKTSKRVRLLNTGEIFPSASEAGRQYNIPSSNISGCCRGDRKSAGKDKNGEKLRWEYIL